MFSGRAHSVFVLPLVCANLLALSACGNEPAALVSDEAVVGDPIMARALTDPMMTDPDLAHRNEANSAVAIRHGHPLPPMIATDELANQARTAALAKLLEDGPIPDLPAPAADAAPVSLADPKTAIAMVSAVNGPTRCVEGMSESLVQADNLPKSAAIMPKALVHQAAGNGAEGCELYVVRYLTPAGIDDVLQYHFALADRARIYVTRYDKPEATLIADSRTRQLVAQTRPASGGMTAVDIVTWAK